MAVLLSIALCGQAIAVGSLRMCHNATSNGALTSDTHSDALTAHDHAASELIEVAAADDAHGAGGISGKDGHHDRVKKGDRVKCAACATCCHFVALPVEVGDGDTAAAANHQAFPQLNPARMRNAGSGLERPPRT
jgi:hypothetical protein